MNSTQHFAHKGIDMNSFGWTAGGLLAVLLFTGCSSPKSPAEQAKDVAATEQVAAREQKEAENKAVSQVEKAAAKVDDKSAALDNTAAKAAYDVAIAAADGDHKVAMMKCEALTGAAIRTCKDRAESDYAAAKADAKAAETAAKQ